MHLLETHIKDLPTHTPPSGLEHRILAAVAIARERAFRMRRALFGSLAGVSALSAIPAFGYALQEISSSAFASYFSLLISDTGTALVNWKPLALSLLESAPVAGAIVSIAAVFVFLASLKALAPYLSRRTVSYSA